MPKALYSRVVYLSLLAVSTAVWQPHKYFFPIPLAPLPLSSRFRTIVGRDYGPCPDQRCLSAGWNPRTARGHVQDCAIWGLQAHSPPNLQPAPQATFKCGCCSVLLFLGFEMIKSPNQNFRCRSFCSENHGGETNSKVGNLLLNWNSWLKTFGKDLCNPLHNHTNKPLTQKLS